MKYVKTCAVMALVILLCVCALNLDTLAATWNGETVYYTVINDEMLELSYGSMPKLHNGTVYVPYSLFVDYFDVKSSYSSDTQVLFMSKDKKMIKFDMNRGLAYDRNQNEIRQAAALLRNQVFVPAEFTANYFGLSCYIHPDAAIVRISDSRATFPDVFLAGQFSSKMESMLARQQYATTAATTTVTTSASSASTAASSAVSTPQSSAVPPSSSQTSASATTVTTTAAPIPPTNVSLCFSGGSLKDVQAVLDWLERNELDACFFIDCSDPDTAAAIVSAGHTLGIRLPDKGTLQTMTDAADTANDRLYRAIRMKTRLVLTYAPGSAGSLSTGLAEAGYAAAAAALRGDRMSAATLESFLQRGTPSLLLMLECGGETVSLLRSLQSTVRRSGGTLSGYRSACGG